MTDNFSSHMLGITTGSPYRQTSKTNHKQVHSNSPNPGALGPGTARNSEMSVSGNSQSSTSLYIVYKLLLHVHVHYN